VKFAVRGARGRAHPEPTASDGVWQERYAAFW
jgi:hypothetical protein